MTDDGLTHGHRGDDGGTPIVNFELTPPPLVPHHKNFKWGTPIKISNWNDEIIKIAEKFAKIL